MEMGSFGGGDAPGAPPHAPLAVKKPRGKGKGAPKTNGSTTKVDPQCSHLRAFLAQGGTNIFTPLARCCLAASFPGSAPKTKRDATLVSDSPQSPPPLFLFLSKVR